MTLKFDSLSLMTKVAMAPTVVLLCLLVVSSFGVWTAQKTSQTLEFLTQKSFVNVTHVAEVQEHVVAVNGMVMQSMAFAGAGLKADVIRALDARIAAELKATKAQLDQLRELFAGDAESLSKLEQLSTAFQNYTKAALDTLDMKDADLSTAAILMSTAETAYGETRKLSSELFKHEVEQADASGDKALASLATGNRTSVGMAALALMLGVFLTWFIARRIVQPLREAVAIARDVASGNLRLRQMQTGTDETGQVLQALAEVTQRLNAMIAEIRNGAEQIDTAASEISNGNNDLASRTEQTASALQATSTSVADLTNTIRVNSDTARRARDLASESAQIAHKGGADVAEVVETMEAISLQAKRISEIIGTIDGIAFQTNILALNASVEAARAGEQGRGFAVVASEVRELAQRSSEAAKEIRNLISASVEQVASGTHKVHAAGETMRQIVSSIGSVSTLVAEISQATASQADEISGVNDAVFDMDKTTQQNAALVEQSAAAAESLKQQAAVLVKSVSVFHVSDPGLRDSGLRQFPSAQAQVSPEVGLRPLLRAA